MKQLDQNKEPSSKTVLFLCVSEFYDLPIEREIIGLSGLTGSFMISREVRIGLTVFRARLEAGTAQLILVVIVLFSSQLITCLHGTAISVVLKTFLKLKWLTT